MPRNASRRNPPDAAPQDPGEGGALTPEERAALTALFRRKKRPRGRPFPKGVQSSPKPFKKGNTVGVRRALKDVKVDLRERAKQLAPALLENLNLRSLTNRISAPAFDASKYILALGGIAPEPPQGEVADLDAVAKPTSPAEVLVEAAHLMRAQLAQLHQAMRTRGLTASEQDLLDRTFDRLSRLEDARTNAVLRALQVEGMTPSKRSQLVSMLAGARPPEDLPPPGDRREGEAGDRQGVASSDRSDRREGEVVGSGDREEVGDGRSEDATPRRSGRWGRSDDGGNGEEGEDDEG